jgi:ATP-binding cassette, subfamily F, member 3
VEALIDALEDFAGTVVIVTHSELIFRRLKLNRIILCQEGSQISFLGDYDLFLEKIGWEEEKKKAPPSNAAPKAATRRQTTPPKKGSEKKIKECEERIIALEAEQTADQKSLEAGDHSPELLRSLGHRQKEIDCLYEELEVLSKEIQKENSKLFLGFILL